MRRLLNRYLTTGGRVLLGAAAASALAGIDPFRTQLAGLFVVMGSFLIVSLAVGWWLNRRLTGSWSAPPRAIAGGDFLVNVRLLTSRPVYDVEAYLDQLPEGLSPARDHWKLWARRREPVVREYSQEYFSRVGIILDTYRPRHFEEAIETAASVAAFLARREAIVDFFAAGETVYTLSVGRQLGSLQSILDLLACVEPAQQAPYARLEAQLGQMMARLSAVVIVSPPLGPERREFHHRLRAQGAPLRLLVVGPEGAGEPDLTYLDPDAFPACLEQI